MSNNLRPDLTPHQFQKTLNQRAYCALCGRVATADIHQTPPPIDLSIHELAEIRGAILAVIDEGRLVNGKREPWSFYGPGDWHMDESGDVNEQRTDFCADVQSLLVKKITG